MPSDSNVFTFDYPFSRDYNYVVELDLSQNTPTSANNYMYNTDSQFLTNYLKSILIDKYGRPVSRGNYRFGFMFRSSDNYTLNSLSSYMEIAQPGSLVNYGEGIYYPSNSIIFNIENENGANVSVVGNKSDISIYKFKTDGTQSPTKVYTMKSANTSLLDSHRYFTYDYEDGHGGTTSTLAIPYSENLMGDGGALYGHIFKLDKLPDGWMYAIGSADSNNKANLYYLAVQGQTDGTIGTDMAKVGNKLEDIDFLVERPAKSDYTVDDSEDTGIITYDSSKLAQFNFTSDYNTTSGEFTINTAKETVAAVDYYYVNLQYVNNPAFITYLFVYDFKSEPAFYINNSRHQTGSSATYTIIQS